MIYNLYTEHVYIFCDNDLQSIEYGCILNLLKQLYSFHIEKKQHDSYKG